MPNGMRTSVKQNSGSDNQLKYKGNPAARQQKTQSEEMEQTF